MARKSHKRHSKKKHIRRTRKTRGGTAPNSFGAIKPATAGGGWMETGKYVPGAPGYQIHQQYEGPGKDCPGVPVRPGYLTSDPAGTGGLPGLNSKLFGGATQLGSGGPVINPGIGYVEPFRGEGGVAGAGRYGSATTTGAMQELKQMGGRYGFVPEVLNPKDGIVAIPAGFGRLPCEVGTKDPLNPNPNGIQTMSTAQGWVPGWTKYITGGGKKGKKTLKRKLRRGGGVPEPTVTVGAADMMRYYAPNAGYTTTPLNPAVQNNPGIQAYLGYPASAFNQACLKTGGGTIVPTPLLSAVPAKRTGGGAKRKNRKVGGVNAYEEVVVPTEVEVEIEEEENNMNINNNNNNMNNNMNGGAYPVAEMAGKFVPVNIKDYATGMLPVKFGGSFVASSPGLLNPTVGTLAGPAMGEQRIAITHNIPGATVYNGPVSKPVAGGKRKPRSNKRKSNKK